MEAVEEIDVSQREAGQRRGGKEKREIKSSREKMRENEETAVDAGCSLAGGEMQPQTSLKCSEERKALKSHSGLRRADGLPRDKTTDGFDTVYIVLSFFRLPSSVFHLAWTSVDHDALTGAAVSEREATSEVNVVLVGRNLTVISSSYLYYLYYCCPLVLTSCHSHASLFSLSHLFFFLLFSFLFLPLPFFRPSSPLLPFSVPVLTLPSIENIASCRCLCCLLCFLVSRLCQFYILWGQLLNAHRARPLFAASALTDTNRTSQTKDTQTKRPQGRQCKKRKQGKQGRKRPRCGEAIASGPCLCGLSGPGVVLLSCN